MDRPPDELPGIKESEWTMQATNEKPITQRKHSRPAAGRGTNGRFPVGVSGNPEGRPQGSRHRASVLAEALLDGRVEALTEKAVEMALTGEAGPQTGKDEFSPPRHKDTET